MQIECELKMLLEEQGSGNSQGLSVREPGQDDCFRPLRQLQLHCSMWPDASKSPISLTSIEAGQEGNISTRTKCLREEAGRRLPNQNPGRRLETDHAEQRHKPVTAVGTAGNKPGHASEPQGDLGTETSGTWKFRGQLRSACVSDYPILMLS